MSEEHLALIRKLPSIVSGGRPCQAHHLMISAERGVSLRARDMWAVPLTSQEHRELHKRGSKFHKEWFHERGIENIEQIARMLWDARGKFDEMLMIIQEHRP